MDSRENFPPVPLTLEGASVLHQMFRLKWPAWRALSHDNRRELGAAATAFVEQMEKAGSALFSLLGHKGDLMWVHFRSDFEALGDAERCVAQLGLTDFLEQTTSYVSVVELGLYESSLKVYSSLVERGVTPHSEEWNSVIEETLTRQRQAMRPRLYPEMPAHKYICFYPMDRRRGEQKNWYELSMTERQRQMQEHGEVGRRYAGTVKQIITGSIGFDDWEWGVDLFAEDPLVFKRLIYEMRFDEVSAVYALFGSFYVGQRVKSGDLEKMLVLA